MYLKKVWIILAFIFVADWASFSMAEDMVLAVDDWCPYICDLSSSSQGIMLDILKDIFKPAGKNVSFQKFPLTRGIREVQLNHVQGIVGILPTMAADLIFPRQPLLTTQFCFFTLSDSKWKFKGFHQKYDDVLIGVIEGKEIGPLFNKAFSHRTEVLGVDQSVSRLIKMLRKRRIDILIEEKNVVASTLKKGKMATLRMAGCLAEKNEFVGFSPSNPRSKEYAEIFEKGILKLKKNEKIQTIIKRYIED